MAVLFKDVVDPVPDDASPLHRAVLDDSIDEINELLEAGADLNARDRNDGAPLHWAAAANSPQAVERLIEAGASPNARSSADWTPLHWGAAYGSNEAIDRLLEAGADPNSRDDQGETALHKAGSSPLSPEAVERLLEAGADPNARDQHQETPLHQVSFSLSPDVVERLLQAGADPDARDHLGQTPLHRATHAGSTRSMDLLLKAGANPDSRNEEGRTALHDAAALNTPEASDRLIEAGANVNARDNQGVTPLHYSAAAWASDTVDRLLVAGADPQAQDKDHKLTPLHHAIDRDRIEVVNRLLQAGTDPNTRDSEDSTLLHKAARSGSPEMVERLLAAGADPHARDNRGRTALHWASGLNARVDWDRAHEFETEDRVAAVEHLIKAGAPVNARDDNGRTALHEAAALASPKVTDRLIKAEAIVNVRDMEGRTALHQAAMQGSAVTAQRLLEAGANINARDDQGKTALQYSTELEPGANEYRKVFEEHQARQEQTTESAQADHKKPIEETRTKQPAAPLQEQQALEKAAPPKRRWWRRRGKSSSREGSEDKAKKPSRPSAQAYAKQASEKVIKQLEKGVAPWQKPWDTPTGANEPPHNPVSGTRYQGLNSIVLRAEATERGYSDPRWVTYKQAKEIGAQVRKGQHGTRIEYWKFPVAEEDKDKGASQPAGNGNDPQERKILHRTYTVFNAEQIDNMPEREPNQTKDWEASERADRLIKESGADIVHVHGDRAFYRPKDDQIVLPKREQFRTHEAYYSTTLHEMGHWTGHSERLNRDTLREAVRPEAGGYGSEAYAKEELRAEMTSMTVNGVMKLPHDPERHASYVDSWIKVLKEDPNELRHAARDAGAAADYLLQYDRERPRDVEQPSHQADHSSPMPERPLSRTQEPQQQVTQEQEVSLSR